MSWLSAHSSGLQVILNGAMVLVWIIYLQVFLIGYLRHQRPDIIVSAGSGIALKARCFVTNLGLEPVYISDIIVDIETEAGHYRSVITDRSELSAEEISNPGEATNQGPLPSATRTDIGSFQAFAERARTHGYQVGDEIRSFEVIVVAMTATKNSMIFSARTYKVCERNGQTHVLPTTRGARQITSKREIRKLHKELDSNLAD